MSTTPTGPVEPGLNLHLQQLNYLRVFARSRTLAEAAGVLGLSQPGLSQALDEIERRVGLPLFERVGRRRRLNQDGECAAEFAAEILGRAEVFAGEMHRRRHGDGGTLRVGTIDAGSLYILPEALKRFRRSAPGVDLRLSVGTSTELESALLRHDLDLAFVIDDGRSHPQLRHEDFLEEKLYLYGPGSATVPGPEDDWVLYPSGSHTREEIDRQLARRGWVPRVRLESSNPQVLRQMVALGFGWSVLPRGVAEIGPSPLVPARVRPLARRQIVISRRQAADDDKRVQRLLDLARGWARRQQRL